MTMKVSQFTRLHRLLDIQIEDKETGASWHTPIVISQDVFIFQSQFQQKPLEKTFFCICPEKKYDASYECTQT